MTRTLYFRMVLRKFSEITNDKPIFSQYNVFYNYEYFFFQSVFWSFFNHRERSQSNQEQCSLCCSSPGFRVLLCTDYGPLQCVSTYFRKLKEIGVLWPIFPGYVISCDYGLLFIDSENLCFILILREKMARFLTFNIVHLSRLTSFVFYQKQNVRAFIIILGVTMKGVPFES